MIEIEAALFQIASAWVKNHGCFDTVNRYSVKYTETSKDVYSVTCKRCGATTTIKK